MDNLREDVIKCLALLEALIDFGEGEDLEEGVYDQGSSLAERVLCSRYKYASS
jgi:tRNA modification GTPase